MEVAKRVVMRWVGVLALLTLTGCSSFELTSQPTADIYENGEKIGATPYHFTLMSGYRSFTLKKFGYVEQDVNVTSLDSRQQHFNLQWIGRTQVDTFPAGAKVVRVEDNEVLGETPCSLFLSRSADVMIKLDGFEEIERDLVPNQKYSFELTPKHGFKSAFYRDILFTSKQGPVEIYDRIAGTRLGVTPIRLTLEAGSELEYRLDGYRSEFALISRTAPYEMEISLDPVAKILLTGPKGALVYRAGATQSIGQLPLAVEVDQSEFFEVKKEGYYDRTVAVAPGSPASLDVQLEMIPYKTIVTDPPGADIYRLGGLEKLGTSPFTTVVSGECVFEIKMRGYKPYAIGVGPSSPAQLNVPLSPAPGGGQDAAAIGDLDSAVVNTF